MIRRINKKIRDEKLQYGINREAAKISALSSGKIDKYEYLTGEKQAKFTYSALEKSLKNQTVEKHEQTEVIEDQEKNKSKL